MSVCRLLPYRRPHLGVSDTLVRQHHVLRLMQHVHVHYKFLLFQGRYAVEGLNFTSRHMR